MILKVDTFKSGSFYFSSDFDRKLVEDLLCEAFFLFKTIAEIPILPDILSSLEEELIRKSIFGTAAIEGNPLSEDDVNQLLSQEEANKKLKKAEQQIVNLKNVYKVIRHCEYDNPGHLILTEEIIKRFHSILTLESEGADNIPGSYRNDRVKVGDSEHGGVYVPPKIREDIETLMQQFIVWINSEEILKEDRAIRAALAHYHFALIHPFHDGNGRTARAIEALLLKGGGIRFVPHSLSNFYYKKLDEYFLSFSLAERNEKHDVTPFIHFFLKAMVTTLKELKDKIFIQIRVLTLKNYYTSLRKDKNISQREFDFLMLMLASPEDFSLKDLFYDDKKKLIYRGVSERTARRDIDKLLEKKLIKEVSNGKFILNQYVLG